MKQSQLIKLSKIFLDLGNPRHEPFNSEKDAIGYLWAEEQILNLAKDIAINGLSDFETPAVVKSPKGNYTVIEGNRRICALKLLTDPELAPDEKSKIQMRKIAAIWDGITEVLAVVYDSDEDENLLLWREKTHLGQDEGRGRRAWSPQAKQRHTKLGKYITAEAILKYAVAQGWLSQEESLQVPISTLQRVLDNKFFKTMTGLRTEKTGVKTDLHFTDFDTIFQTVVADVSSGRINTRKGARTAVDIENYSKQFPPRNGQVAEWSIHTVVADDEGDVELDSREHSEGLPVPNSKAVGRNVPPPRPNHLQRNVELKQLLIPYFKLASLHHSVTTLPLNGHECIITVGVWSFFETLTAVLGRKQPDDIKNQQGQSFPNFIDNIVNNQKHSFTKEQRKSMKAAYERLHREGNIVKHDKHAGLFSGTQLTQDWETCMPILLKLAELIPAK